MSGNSVHFVTLGIFIIDEFQHLNPDGSKTGQVSPPQMGGNGIYAAIGARIWLPPTQVGMVIEKGHDFPVLFQTALEKYGKNMWLFKDVLGPTTRSLSTFQNGIRTFRYLTDRPPTTSTVLQRTRLQCPRTLHFHCAPTEAISLIGEIDEVHGWKPTTIYEPHPLHCNATMLKPLLHILPRINILSPNSHEALALLSMTEEPSKAVVERAAAKFLEYGVGPGGQGHVVIRCHDLGAYVVSRQKAGRWVDAYWTKSNAEKVRDVTGAGNSFLGGLSAGLYHTKGDVYEAALYAAVSASFTVEQPGLPILTRPKDDANGEEWNGESPKKRLQNVQARLRK